MNEPPLWPYGAPSNSFNQPCTLPAPPELAGNWTGRFDSLKFGSGSSAIRIDVLGAFEQSDGLCGTVTFGQGTAPPVAMDPKAIPPGEPSDPDPGIGSSPLEGFPYEFYQQGTRHATRLVGNDGGVARFVDAGLSEVTPALDGDRVTFAVTLREPFKSWCNLQFSYSISTDGSSGQALLSKSTTNCIPATAVDDKGDTQCMGPLTGLTFRGVSCAQAEYCIYQVCDCESVSFENKSPPHGCTVRPTNDAPFNLILNGTELSGTVGLVGWGGAVSVHLTRAG